MLPGSPPQPAPQRQATRVFAAAIPAWRMVVLVASWKEAANDSCNHPTNWFLHGENRW
jgi:hypothetical protein